MLISPKFNFKSHRKQMLLIIKYIQTKLYLILDDDIISVKTFGYNDLFINKKFNLMQKMIYMRNHKFGNVLETFYDLKKKLIFID